MSLEKKTLKIVSDFSFFESWEQKYEYLIELGKQNCSLNKDFKTDLNLVYGCQAKVWLVCKIKNGKLIYRETVTQLSQKAWWGYLLFFLATALLKRLLDLIILF